MQQRHTDRLRYFMEQAGTAREFYLDYLRPYITLGKGTRILEIGCGEGGNLLPFAESDCLVTGIDLDANRIAQAQAFFSQAGMNGTFFCLNFLQAKAPLMNDIHYDIILIHDVIEHILPEQKHNFMVRAARFLRPEGIIFIGFPAWQNPFGGHQQISIGWVSKLPFIHLLPCSIYRRLLHISGTSSETISELMLIRKSRMTIENFERLTKETDFTIKKRTLWLINPHYKQKFHLRPLQLWQPFARLPYIRNFYTTSAFYLLSQKFSGSPR